MRHFLAAVLAVTTATPLAARAQRPPVYQRVYQLKPDEGVFAYARISPDGNALAYASELHATGSNRVLSQTVTVVDLVTKRQVFTERGIDAYWSSDGERMIYSSFDKSDVSIRHHPSGRMAREVAPNGLGDYYSWATRDGRELILTITSNYYYLDGDKAILPVSHVTSCPGIGVGDRPLISHDGKRITTFVRGNVVVRGLDNCDDIFDTGLPGAKADFSWDGRYIAFHVPKQGGKGYEIDIVDLRDHTVRTLNPGPGSSLFPSWTRDGRLCFRYDAPDYQGFIIASDVLTIPAQPLAREAAKTAPLPARRTWADVFPETPNPAHRTNLVLVWAPWSAHSPVALADLQRFRESMLRARRDVGVMMAADPASRPADVTQLMSRHKVSVPRIPLAAARLNLTEANNQMPTTLLFRDGVLVDRKMGAQTEAELRSWVDGR